MRLRIYSFTHPLIHSFTFFKTLLMDVIVLCVGLLHLLFLRPFSQIPVEYILPLFKDFSGFNSGLNGSEGLLVEMQDGF